MNGVVTGGWGFVIAAYAVTTIAFIIYGVSLIAKLRDERSRAGSGGSSHE